MTSAAHSSSPSLITPAACHLYQVCFLPEHFASVSPAALPLSNLDNPHPEQREYYLFRRLWDSSPPCDRWGMFSARSETKLRYPLTHIANTVAAHPTADVHVFNHARVQSVVFWNVWTQGEHFHPGISDIARHLLDSCGYDAAVVDDPMTPDQMCFCSYFVATKDIWRKYLEFLSRILAAADTLPPALRACYDGSAQYTRDPSLGMLPFIVERMFSTYLILHQHQLHAYSDPYDYTLYHTDMGTGTMYSTFFRHMTDLHAAKCALVSDSTASTRWASLVTRVFREMPHWIFLDG